MRSLSLLGVFLFVLLMAAAAPSAVFAGPTQTASVLVTANFTSKTSLKVSTELLHFVGTGSGEALATVEFIAAARTRSDGDVVLTVEAMRGVDGPGGAADVETAVTFQGEGAGARSGVLSPVSASVAGRWSGSGRRTGRLVFALRAAAAGTYTVPVRFSLSAP
jgi:hypothetical protein